MLLAPLLPCRVSVERGGLCRWSVGKLLWPGGSAQHVSLKPTPIWKVWRGRARYFLCKWGMLCVTTHTCQGWFYTQALCKQWNFQIVSPVSWLKQFQQKISSLKVILYHKTTKYCALYFVFCLALKYLVLKSVCEALCHAIRRHLLLLLQFSF